MDPYCPLYHRIPGRARREHAGVLRGVAEPTYAHRDELLHRQPGSVRLPRAVYLHAPYGPRGCVGDLVPRTHSLQDHPIPTGKATLTNVNIMIWDAVPCGIVSICRMGKSEIFFVFLLVDLCTIRQ